NMQNTKAENQPPQRSSFALLDRGEEVGYTFFTHSFDRADLLGVELIDVTGISHQLAANELFDHHFAKPLDIHRPTRCEMFHPALQLGRTPRVNATQGDLTLVFDDFAAAHRTGSRHSELLFLPSSGGCFHF